MTPEEILISNFTAGCLNETEAAAVVECMQDPAFAAQAIDDLSKAELISREFNPARSDTSFLESLNTMLDGALDSELGDSGDPADGGDSDLPDGDAPVPEPSTATGAGGGTSAVTTTLVTVSVITALVSGAWYLTQDQTVELPPDPPAPAHLVMDIVAGADADVHDGANRKKNFGKEKSLTVHSRTNSAAKSKCASYIRFNLNSLPDTFLKAELSLTPLEVDDNMPPIVVEVIEKDDWKETGIKHANKPGFSGKVLTSYSPDQETTSQIDVTDVVREEKAKDGKVTFLLLIPEVQPAFASTVFASREYPDKKRHPKLRITYLPQEQTDGNLQ